MLRSGTFRRIFVASALTVIGLTVAVYVIAVPLIERAVLRLGEETAENLLEHTHTLLATQHSAIEAYRQSALDGYKRQLKNITLVQESYLRGFVARWRRGELTLAEAQSTALEELRRFRYGNNDYLWVSDDSSRLISHPDPALHNADFSQVRDIYGNLIVPPMVEIARAAGEGYTTYWWKRLGEEQPIEKLTYSRDFPEWKWVIGTGVYIDDVQQEVERRRERAVDELRQVLRNIQIARTGYMYVFDSDFNMIIHPNPNIEGTNFGDLLDPVTNRPIGQELVEVCHTSQPFLRYRWDSPEDKGNYVYDKISWVRYSPEFDWYIASSVYTEELYSPARELRRKLLMVLAAVLLLSLGTASLLVHRLLGPLHQLATMARRVERGDLTARATVRERGELGLLAAAMNGMVERLDGSIRELDQRVQERTAELDEKTVRLEAEVGERQHVQAQLEDANRRLTSWVRELEQRHHDEALLNEMGDLLQVCRSVDETSAVLRDVLRDLFPADTGVLYLADHDGRSLRTAVSWGHPPPPDTELANDGCWSLRRGKVHVVAGPDDALRCHHFESPPAHGSVCAPLVAHGEVLGMLNVRFGPAAIGEEDGERERWRRGREQFVVTVSEHLGLALANLRLRESLERMSVRDPLTELYNRRHMEETLEREARRSERTGASLGVVMLDIDHFKDFNDRFGHETGDHVLRHLGVLLRQLVRGDDVACRFGGEEFTVILPGVTADECARRAEEIRRAVERDLRIIHHGSSLSVTVSAGVAVFPDDGHTPREAIAAADHALYRAKAGGRNRVELFATPKGPRPVVRESGKPS